jgi:hypothetical protein
MSKMMISTTVAHGGEPLKNSLVFDRDEGEPVQIHFKYEKLSNFCFACGVIGHTENFCTKHYDATFTEGEKGWGII